MELLKLPLRTGLTGGGLLRRAPPGFDIDGVKDLVLLLGLGAANSAVTRLFDLLGQRDFRARAAHCLVQAWVRKNASAFPEEQSAAQVLRCIELLELSKHSCGCGFELWRYPPAVLALPELAAVLPAAERCVLHPAVWLGVKAANQPCRLVIVCCATAGLRFRCAADRAAEL